MFAILTFLACGGTEQNAEAPAPALSEKITEAVPAEDTLAIPEEAAPALCDPEKTRMHELTLTKASEIKFNEATAFSNDGEYIVSVNSNSTTIAEVKMNVANGRIMSGEASTAGFAFCAYNVDFGYDGLPIDQFCVKPSEFKATTFSIDITADYSEYTLANCKVTIEG